MQFVGCLHVFRITMDLTSLSENKKKIISLTTAVQILVI